jgi:hypothetical protein
MSHPPFYNEDLDEPGHYAVDESFERRLDADPNLFHVVAEDFRPGMRVFFRVCELTHFKPGTKDNDNFNLMRRYWQEMVWWIGSFPQRFRPAVEKVADDCGMRLADGVPHVFAYGGVFEFPMRSKRVWKLENKATSIIYEGPAARDMAGVIERSKIRDVERAFSAWWDQQDTIYHRGRTWRRLCFVADMRNAKPGDPLLPEPPKEARELWMNKKAGRPAIWYTTEPRNPQWRPYPK